MRKLVPLAVAAVLGSVPLQAAPKLAPEARLASLIDGRAEGAPVSCINLRGLRSTQIIEGTAIVYRAGSTVYVNRPRSGAQSLSQFDTFVTKPFSNRLCSADILEIYDTTTGTPRGVIFLRDFVPYRGPGITRR